MSVEEQKSPSKVMALNKPLLTDKVHYSSPSGGGGGYHPHGNGGGGYGYGGGHVYSSIGHSGYGGYEGHGHSSKGSGKKSVALSALTLLAFLFFLHILQSCLEEQSTTNSTTTTYVVMSARKENREKPDAISKRKGEAQPLEYDEYAEKKSTHWEELGTVTTRVKTFSKGSRDGL